MEKSVNVRALAIKEISKEKARIFRKKTEGPSFLEQLALAWKKNKEAEERQRETLKREISQESSFGELLAKRVVDYDKQKLSDSGLQISRDEIGWVQYKPWRKEEDEKKKKQIPLNMATIVAIRKKLIAMEWARALGKRTQSAGLHKLEQEAAIWKQKIEEEKRKREEIMIRVARHKEILSQALAEFGKRLKEKKDTMDSKELATLLKGSLENAGEVFDIEWHEISCFIWIEPWEEKKLRRISGVDIPVIYRVKIDENLEIFSYEKVEDEEMIESLREEILNKPLRESLDETLSFRIDNEEAAKQFLEDKLFEIGRLIKLERTKDGWLATVEPWEEMRLRNVKRGGEAPIVTEEIEIDWKDGRLEFVSEEEEDLRSENVVEVEEDKTLEGGQRK